ncbi:hypothetical protein FO519_005156 [Halicephalobus sp. NKZ332]|nr:hypothetical protein FO519_005156 [Halicephalobus sp. NKZ332]
MSGISALVPNSILVKFYISFSYIALTVTLLLAPIVFYVILTQSKQIGNFKWLILNHTVWCFCQEVVLGIVKFVPLSPYTAVYQAGYFSETNFQNSVIFVIIFLILTINSVMGVIMTMFTRYTVLFPAQWQQIVYRKETYFLLFVSHIIFNTTVAVAVLPSLRFSKIELYEEPMKADPEFENFVNLTSFFYMDYMIQSNYNEVYINVINKDRDLEPFVVEPSFGYIDKETFIGAVYATVIMITFIYIACGVVVTIFLYQVNINYKKNNIINKLQRSLTINALVQMFLFCIFLMLPPYFLLIFICFNIENTSAIMIILVSMDCIHFPVDVLATFYFVSPYKKFVREIFGRRKTLVTVYPGKVNASILRTPKKSTTY